MSLSSLLRPSDTFVRRHIGPSEADVEAMLRKIGVESLDALIDATVPESIRLRADLAVGEERAEDELLRELRGIASRNRVLRSLIGMGYHDTILPPVIQRNILENPGWYTQYTPYQAEISQGRLEALVNFQTLVADLTGLPLSNASLLDEATAAAEAMAMAHAASRRKRSTLRVAEEVHPQTLAVLQTRAEPMGIRVVVAPTAELAAEVDDDTLGVLLQYPATDGAVDLPAAVVEAASKAGALVLVAADLLALTLLRPPGEWGADIVIGSAQRFGVPMGYGGPHAAFLATHETFARQMPGRIVGVSRDAVGNPAYRLALQTREQHIRRDKATSNICTAQVLLAIIASMYAVYHGPEGLRRIATRVHLLTAALAEGLRRNGAEVVHAAFFDTIRVRGIDAAAASQRAVAAGFNLRQFDDGTLGVALDERSSVAEVATLIELLSGRPAQDSVEALAEATRPIPEPLIRTSPWLEHPVFHSYHSEHEMLRYIHRLQARDLSLTTSMIPLGSCTMKLNATSEMLPVTWPEFGQLHPFAPADQAEGYRALFTELERMLCDVTGFAAFSLQPNAGSQGEYAGLLSIRAWHLSRGDDHRDVCLIPTSAHGTNPASAAMVGMRVVVVQCDERGNIDLTDLRRQAEKHADRLAALMITYPSTHGVFEAGVREACEIVHAHGGQVYMDGANMNAQVGLCRPGDIGADVCHLNLHKTFCIPHGGGGPGMGPIGVAEHLAPFLPGHPVHATGGATPIGPVSAAPWGSASILPISWVYMKLMGSTGLRRATEIAILNANYMAARLRGHYDVVYTGADGRVAHEFIIDLRPFKASAGVETEDIAKRLMDYGYHAPTMSFPVAGTLMIEPTESESRSELDRFCDAMIAIRDEIRAIESGALPTDDNPLRNAPHTAQMVAASEWTHAYSREQAAFPVPWVRANKFWPSVARVDNAWGDRNLQCTCPPMSAWEAAE